MVLASQASALSFRIEGPSSSSRWAGVVDEGGRIPGLIENEAPMRGQVEARANEAHSPNIPHIKL